MQATHPDRHHLVVDLDERGSFKAHVEDGAGQSVFEFSNEGENGWPDEDGLWLINDGYMKHKTDVSGLREYLVAMQFMQPHQQLMLGGA